MIPTVRKVSPSNAMMTPPKAIAARRIARFTDRSTDSDSLPIVLRMSSRTIFSTNVSLSGNAGA